MYMKPLFFFCLLSLSLSCKQDDNTPAPPPPASKLEIIGADASYVPEIRKTGFTVKNAAGQTEDMLVTLQKAGVNTIRLRLWHTPPGGHSGFEEVKDFTKEIQALGLKVLLTVHYSDSWADPGKQTKPTAWKSASMQSLKDSVYQYTQRIALEIKPEYIQIGNEINAGLLWPEGSVSNPTQMNALLSEGIRAVREHAPNTQIMIHYAGHQQAAWFFEQVKSLDYDMIGLSYYPIWHGKDTALLQTNMTNLANKYNKKMVIAETAYPFSLGWNDNTNNIIGQTDQLLPGFPATPSGQKAFVSMIKSLENSTPKYAGFCYWGGEWVAFKGNASTEGSNWENQAFWGFDRGAMDVLNGYGN